MKISSFTERLPHFQCEFTMQIIIADFAWNTNCHRWHQNLLKMYFLSFTHKKTSTPKTFSSNISLGNKRVNRSYSNGSGYKIPWLDLWKAVAIRSGLTVCKNGLPLKIGFPDTVYLCNKLNEEHAGKIEDIRKRRNIKLAKMDLSSKKMGMVPVFPRS